FRYLQRPLSSIFRQQHSDTSSYTHYVQYCNPLAEWVAKKFSIDSRPARGTIQSRPHISRLVQSWLIVCCLGVCISASCGRVGRIRAKPNAFAWRVDIICEQFL